MIKIDVDSIMQDIRDDYQLRRIDGTVLPFDEVEIVDSKKEGLPFYSLFSYQRLEEIDHNMNSRYDVSTDMLLERSGGISGRVKAVVKRYIRKCLIPVVREQNDFNAFTTEGMNMMMCFVQESLKHRKRVASLEKQMDDCGKQIAVLQDQIRQMKEDRGQ